MGREKKTDSVPAAPQQTMWLKRLATAAGCIDAARSLRAFEVEAVKLTPAEERKRGDWKA